MRRTTGEETDFTDDTGVCEGQTLSILIKNIRHDELVAECPKEQVEDVADLLEEIMVDGMDEVINPRLSANHPERLPHSAGCAVCFYSREEVTLG